MKKQTPKKLVLDLDTLRKLSASELQNVVGGTDRRTTVTTSGIRMR